MIHWQMEGKLHIWTRQIRDTYVLYTMCYTRNRIHFFFPLTFSISALKKPKNAIKSTDVVMVILTSSHPTRYKTENRLENVDLLSHNLYSTHKGWRYLCEVPKYWWYFCIVNSPKNRSVHVGCNDVTKFYMCEHWNSDQNPTPHRKWLLCDASYVYTHMS